MSSNRIGRLVDHRYGKADVRLLCLDRTGRRHHIFEANVSISLEGDFAEAYAEGDNGRVLPTDSMKNTVYGLAREQPFESSEGFALLLARHFVGHSQVSRATVRIAEKPWDRYGAHHAAFVAGGEHVYTAKVTVEATGGVSVTSGVSGLHILKSSDSAFSGFPRDRFTQLEETEDRIFSTQLEGRWDLAQLVSEEPGKIDFLALRRSVMGALLEAFADHHSRSVQHTLYWMGEAALAAAPQIERIFLRMPNKHYLLARLGAFDMDNPNHIFVPIDEPAGMIEGTIERKGSTGSPARQSPDAL